MDTMSGFSPTEKVVEVLVTRRTNILTQLFSSIFLFAVTVYRI